MFWSFVINNQNAILLIISKLIKDIFFGWHIILQGKHNKSNFFFLGGGIVFLARITKLCRPRFSITLVLLISLGFKNTDLG